MIEGIVYAQDQKVIKNKGRKVIMVEKIKAVQDLLMLLIIIHMTN